MLHMTFWKFTLAEICCVIFTVPLQLGVGILIGRGFGGKDTMDLVLSLIGGIMVVVAIMAAIGWWRQHRKLSIRPRAKAKWLRRFRVPRIHAHRKPTKA
jgi:membrane protein DedA with SNARE-associated domain